MGFSDGPPIATLPDSRSKASAGNDRVRVIAARLRAEIALLSVGIVVAAAPLFAVHAAEAGQEHEPPTATRSATHPEKPGPPSEVKAIDGWASRLQKKQNWWNHAIEVLFTDIEISAEQARGVDAIIDEQLDTRVQLQQSDVQIRAARKSRDPERIEAARSAFVTIRAQLKEPHEIYQALRALLSEAQRPQFDMNRARLIAESQAPPKERAAQTEQRNRAKPKTR
jgi:hypothetical protein